jgi:hypothetical protein
MTLHQKTPNRIIRRTAVLALAMGGFFGLAATPAFASFPVGGYTLVGYYPTEAACEAGGDAGLAAHEWTDFECSQKPPSSNPWGLYAN